MRKYKQHLQKKAPKGITDHAFGAVIPLPGRRFLGKMRNWNKKQHLPQKAPKGITDHAFGAVIPLLGRRFLGKMRNWNRNWNKNWNRIYTDGSKIFKYKKNT